MLLLRRLLDELISKCWSNLTILLTCISIVAMIEALPFDWNGEYMVNNRLLRSVIFSLDSCSTRRLSGVFLYIASLRCCTIIKLNLSLCTAFILWGKAILWPISINKFVRRKKRLRRHLILLTKSRTKYCRFLNQRQKYAWAFSKWLIR